MNNTTLPVKTVPRVIDDICAKVADLHSGSGPAYTMIVGAGFSHGSVPLTRELLNERIGDYYYDRQDLEGGSEPRPRQICRKLSADYWKEFNGAARDAGELLLEVDRDGLPVNTSAAYQSLFTYRVANALFSRAPDLTKASFVTRFRAQRAAPGAPPASPRVLAGEKFVKDFLLNVLVSGGREIRERFPVECARSGRLEFFTGGEGSQTPEGSERQPKRLRKRRPQRRE